MGGRRGRRGRGRRHGPGVGLGFFGCLLVGLILFVGAVTALATWIAAALLGVVAPDAAPSALTAGAVIVILVLGILVAIRVFGTAIRPLAELADAADRLADGEPGVRVQPRGPGAVRRLVISFDTMADRLDRSREARRALLAEVTHELRTPLTVISGGLEAMVDGVHAADEDHLAPILAETRVMDRLLDDLRTLSLADAGALTLHRELTDAALLAEQVVASQQRAAAQAGIELRATGSPMEAMLDPVRFREIVTNLVTNALRHTPSGGHVLVDVRATADPAEVVLTVTDDGEGIDPEDLERVFDRFQRRADSRGSGLGLAIVRALAVAHGGSAEAASDGVPGHGSAFRVRLPKRD
jgi:two-component system sensor histidine kinase BaeS